MAKNSFGDRSDNLKQMFLDLFCYFYPHTVKRVGLFSITPFQKLSHNYNPNLFLLSFYVVHTYNSAAKRPHMHTHSQYLLLFIKGTTSEKAREALGKSISITDIISLINKSHRRKWLNLICMVVLWCLRNYLTSLTSLTMDYFIPYQITLN